MDISVVVPTRNRSGSLSRLLQSLARQSFPGERFEVLLVDNASTDETREVASQFGANLPHFKLLTEGRVGAATARNRGIRESAGELIVFVDDDVIPAPQMLEEHWRAHQQHPESAILGRVTFPWTGRESPFHWVLTHRPGYLQSFQFDDPHDVPFNHFYSCNASVPRRFLDRAGHFDENFLAYGFEDTDLGYRLVRSGARIVFNPRAEALHDFQRDFARFARDRFHAGQSFRQLLLKHPELRDWSARQGSSARRCLVRILGFLAAPLTPIFNSRWPSSVRFLLPVLGRACACHLQYQFWRGFGKSSRTITVS